MSTVIGKDMTWCSRAQSQRTDLGCLHCVWSAKLGELWVCFYEEESTGDVIVRCRDCVYFNIAEPQGCTLFDFAAPNHADGFCSWGERKVVE